MGSALRFMAWFEQSGWTSEGGRPLCPACRPGSAAPVIVEPVSIAPRTPRVCVSSDEIVSALRDSLAA